MNMADCEYCADLSRFDVLLMMGVAQAAEDIENFCGSLAWLRFLAAKASPEISAGLAQSVAIGGARLKLDQMELIAEVYARQVADLGLNEIDALCEPNPFRRHLQALLDCYERMENLRDAVNGRSAAWQQRRREAEQLPPAERNAYLFGGPPPSADVADAERLENERLWQRVKARVHRAEA